MLQNGNGFVRVFFQRNGLPTTILFYVSDISLVAKTFAVAKLAEKYKNLDGEQFRLQICRRLFGCAEQSVFFEMFVGYFHGILLDECRFVCS